MLCEMHDGCQANTDSSVVGTVHDKLQWKASAQQVPGVILITMHLHCNVVVLQQLVLLLIWMHGTVLAGMCQEHSMHVCCDALLRLLPQSISQARGYGQALTLSWIIHTVC